MSGYIVINIVLAVWMLYDGYQRKVPKKWLYFIGTLVLSWLVMPFYLAGRPLKAEEVREGGYAWNILKNFALIWTIVIFISGVAGLISAGQIAEQAQTQAEAAGAGLGIILGFFLLGALWFVPMVGALVLGFFLKNNAKIEEGPTGPLAAEAEASSADESF